MRNLIVCFLILVSCKKDILQNKPDLQYVYYKVKQVNNDGNINYTETRLVRNLTMIPPYSEDTCFNCTVPLLITNFNAYPVSSGFIELDWNCENEEGIKFYIVCKSKNNKQWLEIKKVDKHFGEYKFIDTE